MKKRYILGIALFLALSIYGILNMDYRPRPIEIMKPSFFDRPVEIGAVIYKRLYDPLGRENLLIFGVTPGQSAHQQILEGFLITAKSLGRPIDVIFREDQLEPLQAPTGTVVVDFKFNSQAAELADQVKSYTNQGKRVLIYTASILSSHLIKENPVHRFETFWGKPVLSISTVGIGVRREQKVIQDPPCVGSERDGSGTADLGCAALLKGRSLYRKNIDNSRFVALMDQRGVSDLVLFVSMPVKASEPAS